MYTRSRRKALTCAVLCFFSALVLQLGIRISVIHQRYSLQELQATALELDVILREAELEHAYVMRPAHLIQQAQQRLGLRELTPQQMRHIGASRNAFAKSIQLKGDRADEQV